MILDRVATQNFKRDKPAAVQTVAHHRGQRHELAELLAGLPADRDVISPIAVQDSVRSAGEDPLRAISPDEYLPVLLGQSVGRDRKLTCPFHEDRPPSLHAYSDHWYCFGCRAGGTIYDLAARLWFSGQSSGAGAAPLRGPRSVEIRERLSAMFFGERKGS